MIFAAILVSIAILVGAGIIAESITNASYRLPQRRITGQSEIQFTLNNVEDKR